MGVFPSLFLLRFTVITATRLTLKMALLLSHYKYSYLDYSTSYVKPNKLSRWSLEHLLYLG
ncbi:hypothetical protein QTJ16_006383 [Diplocarpon rosae]|uniref:Uncharacterized protein n=1 Tax=Diplocarpon rosae TaxID=946125 RepID=A0AAD9SWJ3_9HELO|nr:hypothetical protein QTJ16_006383 [Diplocarpon rosae]